MVLFFTLLHLTLYRNFLKDYLFGGQVYFLVHFNVLESFDSRRAANREQPEKRQPGANMAQGMRHTVGTFCQKEGSLLQPQPAEGRPSLQKASPQAFSWEKENASLAVCSAIALRARWYSRQASVVVVGRTVDR